jgi:hypothetical protein
VVTTKKGYSYACTWAIEKDEKQGIVSLTMEQVIKVWREDRKDFEKYNGIHYV